MITTFQTEKFIFAVKVELFDIYCGNNVWAIDIYFAKHQTQAAKDINAGILSGLNILECGFTFITAISDKQTTAIIAGILSMVSSVKDTQRAYNTMRDTLQSFSTI